MMGASGLLRHILACNDWNPASAVPFLVAGRAVGWVRRSHLDMFAGWKDLFSLDSSRLCLREPDCPDEASAAAMRTRMLDRAVGHLIESGQLPRRRGEIYPVLERFGATPLAGLDRAAVAVFGIQAAGVHLNGCVRTPDGLSLWIARRAQNKAVAPGKLDNMVAGGQPLGLSLQDNLIKECGEEAAIPPDLAAQAKPVGAVSYRMEVPEGIRRDTLFLYDLDVPADFVPDNADGEHEAFFLLSVADIVEKLRYGDEFKFNVPLVIIDFMIRHGIIDGENEPDYLDLLKGLRQ